MSRGVDRLATITGEPASKFAGSPVGSTGDLKSLSDNQMPQARGAPSPPAQPQAMGATNSPAAASQQEAAASSSRPEQQLPAELRHRGHAEQSVSGGAAEDPMQPPQPGMATMSREGAEQADEDADKKTARLAAVARGQANSSEVLSCAVRATAGARLLLAIFLAVLLTDLPWSLDFARNQLGLSLPIQAAWHRMPPLLLLALAELALIATAFVLFVCNPDLIHEQIEADAFTMAADGGGWLMKVLGCLPNGRAKAAVWKARLQLFGGLSQVLRP
ncbi:hypothetical protein WJX84_000605 [Apatococcus fuscideae]|uniref:Uncharacterized protein n=1 Tax=Apatococcus fuscideae TaxID=2026836 RepID=A0AAW1SS09_9CHLO